MAYQHPDDGILKNLHNAMEYDALGRPIVRTTATSSITVGSTTSDAFGRSRMSMPYTIFDSQSIHNSSRRYNQAVSGTGTFTYIEEESTLYMEVEGFVGDEVISESNTVMAYQPGKSLLTYQSFKFAPLEPGLRQRVGLFDEKNGVYFEADGMDLYIVLRRFSTGVIQEERYPQSEWSNDSLTWFDPTKTNIFWIDLQWLGVGTVRAGVVHQGLPVLAHMINNDNVRDEVYMTTAVLPLRQEITVTAATGNFATMKQICSSAVSEGGLELTGTTRVLKRNNLTLGPAGVEVPLIAARLSPTHRNSVVVPNQFSVFVESQATVQYNVYFNAKVTNGAWETYPGSSVQWNNTMTTFDVSQAVLARTGYASVGDTIEGGDIKSLVGQFQRLLDGTSIELLLTVSPYNQQTKIHAWTSWVELI